MAALVANYTARNQSRNSDVQDSTENISYSCTEELQK